mmetsp:Transcript_15812/g.23792  ORF Transcript_15812/g.23792 Transcript_15812/m.23792 type:complete len:545 (+) Transcript_15812:79-1713(+)
MCAMDVPSVPVDIMRVIQRIANVFETIMADIIKNMGHKGMSVSRIANHFFEICGMHFRGWAFCDIMFIRFFERVAKKYLVGKTFILFASCFIACICLQSSRGIMKMVVDVYANTSDRTKISLAMCENIFRSVLVHSSGDSAMCAEEASSMFKEYLDACPLPGAIFQVKKSSDVKVFTDLDTFLNFCCRAHPTILWPVRMMQKQLQTQFLGVKFWEKLMSSDLCSFLNSKEIASDSFQQVEILCKLYTSSLCVSVSDEGRSGKVLTTQVYDQYFARKTHVVEAGRNRFDVRLRQSLHIMRESYPANPVPRRESMYFTASMCNRKTTSTTTNPGSKCEVDEEELTEEDMFFPPASTPNPPPSLSNSVHDSPSNRNESETPSNLQQLIDPFTGELLRDIRVLVIEDSCFQRKLIVRRLMHCLGEGMTNVEDTWPEVNGAGTGEEAMSILEKESSRGYDVFVVDENLDGAGGVLKGHEVISILRKNPHMKDVIIIGCTSNIHKHGAKFIQAGANAVWSKPIPDPVVLQQNLKKLIYQRNKRIGMHTAM